MKVWHLLVLAALVAVTSCRHKADPQPAVDPAAEPAALSASPDSGVVCPEPCPEGTVCKLVNVVCVRAPCPPIPQCVPVQKP